MQFPFDNCHSPFSPTTFFEIGVYSHSTVYIRSHSQSLLVNSKVIASCYVSYGGQESHQRIRKGRDGHGLENPTDVKKKNANRIQK